MSACALARIKLARFVAEIRTVSGTEKATTAIKAGFVGSLVTPMRAVAGNTSWGGMRALVLQPAEAGVDYLLSLGRSARTGFRVKPRELREVANALDADGVGAMWRGFKQGTAPVRGAYAATAGQPIGQRVRNFVQELSARLDAEAITNVLDVERVKYASPVTQTLVDGAFAVLEAADRPFWRAAFDGSIYMQSKLLAIREGATGAERAARARQYFEHPTEEMLARATDDAHYATFKDRNLLSKLATGAKQATRRLADTEPDPAASPYAQAAQRAKQRGAQVGTVMLEQNLPFVGVPSSVAYKMAAVSPLGLLSPNVLGNQAQRARALATAGVGTAMWAAGLALYKEGRITGPMPEDAKERAQWRADGRIPFAVRLGDHWVGLLSLGPASVPLFMGAQLARIRDEEPDAGVPEQAVRGALAAGHVLTEQSYLDGVKRLIDAFGDERAASSLLVSQIPVPAVLGQATRAADPYARDARTLGERVLSRVPGGSFALPKAQAPTGEFVRKSTAERVAAVASPFPMRRASDSPVLTELRRLGVSIGMPSRTMREGGRSTPIARADYEAFVRDAGRETMQALAAMVGDAEYAAMSDDERRLWLENVIGTIRANARQPVRAKTLRTKRQ